MENIILGLQAVQKLMRIEIGVMISSTLIQGFFVGFFVATLVFAFVSEQKSRKQNCEICKNENDTKSDKINTDKNL
ncbi:hypothetical protein COY25_02385 [Candidatus Uhrbacteria bacterium CG_4_10_14_0_2_um_filter_41_7]|uniref:Uncharacterized protein n=1 Tax=Candidatus Uhrbacteria bacterium CG_4_9_14_3_um_filter_41_35 TaxID=1975034 RepID=A0A2M7XG67_9BACT|nr:MAG: hypothetical protein COV92_02235 [Candidatus Uhrbacteria bacterium CG11_big_fil_rev_8_21_14_0_20_41_9]PIZ54174.1 MAG: hypothetical protein COY25_02385 [Candidatus Uhrbacteria bacterium CG_4_10_14_0_2_um_filter_41_7]PJA46861.1 MAG: hypothetical protein CO173_01405 [Candidatus Uhrbacteria bacterium CG_4_9_14_3_um_filter_41_35]